MVFILDIPLCCKVSHDYTVHAHVCVYCWPCISSSAVHYNTPPMMTGLLAFYRPAQKHTTWLLFPDFSPTPFRGMQVGCTDGDQTAGCSLSSSWFQLPLTPNYRSVLFCFRLQYVQLPNKIIQCKRQVANLSNTPSDMVVMIHWID
jgi:hypothetical protein